MHKCCCCCCVCCRVVAVDAVTAAYMLRITHTQRNYLICSSDIHQNSRNVPKFSNKSQCRTRTYTLMLYMLCYMSTMCTTKHDRQARHISNGSRTQVNGVYIYCIPSTYIHVLYDNHVHMLLAVPHDGMQYYSVCQCRARSPNAASCSGTFSHTHTRTRRTRAHLNIGFNCFSSSAPLRAVSTCWGDTPPQNPTPKRCSFFVFLREQWFCTKLLLHLQIGDRNTCALWATTRRTTCRTIATPVTMTMR